MKGVTMVGMVFLGQHLARAFWHVMRHGVPEKPKVKVAVEVATPERPEEETEPVEFHEMKLLGPYPHGNGKVNAAKVNRRA